MGITQIDSCQCEHHTLHEIVNIFCAKYCYTCIFSNLCGGFNLVILRIE